MEKVPPSIYQKLNTHTLLQKDKTKDSIYLLVEKTNSRTDIKTGVW